MTIQWNDLFDYLYEYIKFGDGVTTADSATCHSNLNTVKDFCTINKLDFTTVERMVRSYGGYCDCEILLNVIEELTGDIPDTIDKSKLGPSDSEEQPGDKWSFLAADGIPGWNGRYDSKSKAVTAMEQMKSRGIEIIFEPSVDINYRIEKKMKNNIQ